jgi:hypothetical protein
MTKPDEAVLPGERAQGSTRGTGTLSSQPPRQTPRTLVPDQKQFDEALEKSRSRNHPVQTGGKGFSDSRRPKKNGRIRQLQLVQTRVYPGAPGKPALAPSLLDIRTFCTHASAFSRFVGSGLEKAASSFFDGGHNEAPPPLGGASERLRRRQRGDGASRWVAEAEDVDGRSWQSPPRLPVPAGRGRGGVLLGEQ